MFKSPRRNGRNKGFKIKHVIQISMLLGVSIWLLYQIHHSDDDKKPSVTTKISHESSNSDSSKDMSKLGRKFLRPKVKGTKEDDEVNNEIKGGSEDVEDKEEQEEVGENEHADSIEDGEEMKEHENEKDDDEKGREQTGKTQTKEKDGNKNGDQNRVVVMEDTEKQMSPSLKDGEMSISSENDKTAMMKNADDESVEDDKSSSKQPSVDHNERDSKEQTEQQIDTAPDSYSYETNIVSDTKAAGNDKNMKADNDSEAQSMNGKSVQDGEPEQKDDVSMLEDEKDALTDLETLPENGTGGSISLDNAATE